MSPNRPSPYLEAPKRIPTSLSEMKQYNERMGNVVDNIMKNWPQDSIVAKFGNAEKTYINQMINWVEENVKTLNVLNIKKSLQANASKEIINLVNSLSPADIVELIVTLASIVALTATGVGVPVAMTLVGRFAVRKWAEKLIAHILVRPNLKSALKWFLGIKKPTILTTNGKAEKFNFAKEWSQEVGKLMRSIIKEFVKDDVATNNQWILHGWNGGGGELPVY